MKIVVFGLAMVLMIFTPGASSRAQNTIGYGETSCRLWIKEHRTRSALSRAYSAWVLGFVSGVNAVGILSFDETSNFIRTAVASGILASINNYCTAHPNDNLDTAAFTLIGELKGNDPHR